ncbi:unnamed protein product [marine sediment metagenome]|uniref:DNA methylase N-4/N-6 domain-containing protein n=1 Tax=marine sediment metagenome TaxID=412755 RepID=X0ZW38_9ZZZZ
MFIYTKEKIIVTNKVYLIDCVEFMKTKPDNYFELAIVDLAYGKLCNLEDGRTKHNGWNSGEFWNKASKGWNNKIPDKKYFDELFRISQNQIIWGGNYFVEFLKGSSGWVFWDKGQRNFSLADGELAFTSFNKALRVFKYSRSLSNFKDIKIHPTQKPVALYKWLLTNYAKEGDKILDTHEGSGSHRIACYELGFDHEGCEKDKDYWKAQEKRFELEKAKIDNRMYIPDDQNLLFVGVV